jgi:hypothetical protein
MKKYIKFFLIVLTGTLFMVACDDSYMGVEQIKTDSTKPEKITVNNVIPKSGALEIYFSLPKGNQHISKVEAWYYTKNHIKREFSVSRYSSFILVEGFMGTDEVTVELRCVDNSGNESDITQVEGTPLKSSLELAMESMEAEPAFGGLKIEWKNKEAKAIAIHVLTEDTLQVGVASLVEDPSKTIYTSDSINTFSYIRQYPAVEQKFGFILSDKWENRTDTLIYSLTPYKEEKIDYKLIKEINFFNPTFYAGNRDYDTYGVNPSTGIQNDGNAHSTSFRSQMYFDGIKTGNGTMMYKFIKNLNDPDPNNRILVNDQYCTFDCNILVRLNRVIMFPRNTITYTFNRSSPKRFRIWGTTDENNTRWSKFPEGWTLIGEYVGVEPANRDNLTPEEIDYFNLNQEYTISEGNVNPDAHPTETFRYMRLQLMESYNPLIEYYTVNEFEMYGDIVEYY